MLSISQLNIEQINRFKNNRVQFINNNIIIEKPIINENKINQKNYIYVKTNQFINRNYKNNNLLTESSQTVKEVNNKINNINYNFTESNLISNIPNKNKNEENSAILNVEEILMIEEKLSSLIKCFADCNPCKEECFECLNFYFTTKLSRNFIIILLRKNI